MTTLRGPLLLGATLTAGMMAGIFSVYGYAVMRGLGRTSDRTFVEAFGAMDRAITNPVFLATFMGPLVLGGAATALYLRDDGGTVLPWVAAATALYLLVFLVTMVVHVPLNDGLKAAGGPDRIAGLAAVRAAFHEARWVAWNAVRAVATTASFGALAWALVLHGRLG